MRIDSHQHFWRPSRGDYGWMEAGGTELDTLRRVFEPADYSGFLSAFGIEQTVLVQAAPTEAETEYLLALADQHQWIGGVVGWFDLNDVHVHTRLAVASMHAKLKGIRPMLQDLADPNWILGERQTAAIRYAARLGLAFDALVRPAQLGALARFAERAPEVRIVIDHAAKPREHELTDLLSGQWASHMRFLAKLPQRTYCKVSGLLTELDPHCRYNENAAVAALQPLWDFLVDHFGFRRLMWGSDWPVLLCAADYEFWLAVCNRLIESASAEDKAHFWAGNAKAFYQLKTLTP